MILKCINFFTNFNYDLFSFIYIYFIVKSNMKKLFSLTFFLSLILFGIKYNLKFSLFPSLKLWLMHYCWILFFSSPLSFGEYCYNTKILHVAWDMLFFSDNLQVMGVFGCLEKGRQWVKKVLGWMDRRWDHLHLATFRNFVKLDPCTSVEMNLCLAMKRSLSNVVEGNDPQITLHNVKSYRPIMIPIFLVLIRWIFDSQAIIKYSTCFKGKGKGKNLK